MGAVQYLFALALRPLIDGIGHTINDPSVRADTINRQLNQHLNERRPQLGRALHHANERAWQVLQIALGGELLWTKVQQSLRRTSDDLARQHIRTFLDAELLAEIASEGPEFRRQCLEEMRMARAEGHLTPGELDLGELFQQAGDCLRPTDAQNPLAEDDFVLMRMADAMRQLNYHSLARLLDARSPERMHLLAAAARHFFRRGLDTEREPALTDRLAAPLEGEESPSLIAIAAALPTVSDRLEALIEELRRSPADGRNAPALPDMEREAGKLLDEKQLRQRALRLSDCLAFADNPEALSRARLLVAKFVELPDEMRKQSPALLESMGTLQVTLGQYEEALENFQQAGALALDVSARARAHWNAYQMALVQSLWSEALEELKKAVQFDQSRYAPLPLTYQAERILGIGGFGVAFLCRSASSTAKVVVKALCTDWLDRDVEEIFRELRILKDLNHPALLKVMDYGRVLDDPHRPYMVMEYFEGPTLAEQIQQGPLGVPHAAALARPIADLLKTVHAYGIWHRHLNPGNIFLRRERDTWTVKVADFGPGLKQSVVFATIGNSAARAHTIIGRSVAGMIDYAAPEQLGLLDDVAPGPDVNLFNFGRLGFLLLLGNPVPDEDDKEALPEGWRKLLGQCLARNPEKRPGGAGALLDRLMHVGDAAPASHVDEPPEPQEPTAPSVPRDARTYHDRGLVYLAKGLHDKALADFTRAVELDPQFASALNHRGEIYLQKGNAEQAFHDFNQALRVDARFAPAHVNRGRVLRLKGRLDRAIADFGHAIRIDPKLADAFINRGNAHIDKGDHDKAIADYSEAIRIDPTLALAYMNRGLAHAKKGDFNAVVADCDAAIRHNAKLVSAYFIRGAAHASKGDHDKAIADFSRVLQLDPGYALAYNDRGLAQAHKGEYDRAIADYNRALRLDPKLALAWMNRAIAYRLKGQHDRAIAEFTKMLRHSPKNALAYTNRGLAYLSKRDYDRAIADFTEALWIDPSYTEAYNRRVEAVRAKSEDAKSGEERRQNELAAKEDRDRRQERAAAHFNRAQMHFNNGNYDRAIADYTEALKYDPKDAFTYYNRGLTYAANEEYDKALGDYTEAIRLNPKMAVAHFHRGVGYRLRGNFARAVTDFTEAIKLDPKFAQAYRNRGLAFASLGEQNKAKGDYDEAIRLDASLAKK